MWNLTAINPCRDALRQLEQMPTSKLDCAKASPTTHLIISVFIDVSKNCDAIPFALSLSKPFDRLRANGI